MNRPERICIHYSRVSTTRQAEDGISLDTQETRMDLWDKTGGFTCIGRFVDAGKSGSDLRKRPEAQKAIAMACEKKATLVVYSLSRLARSIKDAINTAERLQKAGAGLVSLHDNIDLTSATGKLVYHILCAVNQFIRDVASEVTKENLARVRANGKRISRLPRYGYTLDGDDEVQDPAEQEILARIREWTAKGWTSVMIVRQLNKDKVPSRSGRPWARSTVQGLMKHADD